jgi:hypothetical protein
MALSTSLICLIIREYSSSSHPRASAPSPPIAYYVLVAATYMHVSYTKFSILMEVLNVKVGLF